MVSDLKLLCDVESMKGKAMKKALFGRRHLQNVHSHSLESINLSRKAIVKLTSRSYNSFSEVRLEMDSNP